VGKGEGRKVRGNGVCVEVVRGMRSDQVGRAKRRAESPSK
jgi:hypothetical protein